MEEQIKSQDINLSNLAKNSFGGYTKESVEHLIALARTALEKAENQISDMTSRLSTAEERAQLYDRHREELSDAIMVAQSAGRSTIDKANAEAKQIIDNANQEANNLRSKVGQEVKDEKSKLAKLISTTKDKLKANENEAKASVAKMISTAKSEADTIQKTAESEAQQLIDVAEKEASEITASARSAAEEVIASVKDLEKYKERLQAETSSMEITITEHMQSFVAQLATTSQIIQRDVNSKLGHFKKITLQRAVSTEHKQTEPKANQLEATVNPTQTYGPAPDFANTAPFMPTGITPEQQQALDELAKVNKDIQQTAMIAHENQENQENHELDLSTARSLLASLPE